PLCSPHASLSLLPGRSGACLFRLICGGLLLHKLLQAREMNPDGPAHPCRLQLPAAHVSPQRGVAEPGVPLRLRVADPLLLHWLLQQFSLLFGVFCKLLAITVRCSVSV